LIYNFKLNITVNKMVNQTFAYTAKVLTQKDTEAYNLTENSSTIFVPPEPYAEAYWLISEAVLITLTAFSIYLLVCLTRYALNSKCSPGRELNNKKGKFLYRLCLLSVIMAICRLVSDQSVALLGWKTDEHCLVAVNTSTIFYGLSLYPVYIFLWTRQSIFYNNPVLSHILNPVVTFISYATLLVMLVSGVVVCVLHVIPSVTGWDMRATRSGCKDVNNQEYFQLIPLLALFLTVTFQVSLLALFLYPLLNKKMSGYSSPRRVSKANRELSSSDFGPQPVQTLRISSLPNIQRPTSAIDVNNGLVDRIEGKEAVSSFRPPRTAGHPRTPTQHRRETSDLKSKRSVNQMVRTATTTDVSKKDRKGSQYLTNEENEKKKNKRKQHKSVIEFIRKTFYLTLMCVVSDTIMTIVMVTLDLPELAYLVFFDVNLIVNIICIIMSFRDWPKMVFPLCAKRIIARRRKRSSISSTKGSNGSCKDNFKMDSKVSNKSTNSNNNSVSEGKFNENVAYKNTVIPNKFYIKDENKDF